MDPSYKIDEGYSEETRSQGEVDSPMKIDHGDEQHLLSHIPHTSELQEAVLALSELERKELAYIILQSLRVSSISSVVEQIWPLFHRDPVAYFPAEIMSQIFSCLSPANLIEASMVSRTWRGRILDGRLWKDKFQKEGWILDMGEINKYERSFNSRNVRGPPAPSQRKPRRRIDAQNRTSGPHIGQGRLSRPRGLGTMFKGSEVDFSAAHPEGGQRLKRAGEEVNQDEEMPDVGNSPLPEHAKLPTRTHLHLDHRESSDFSDSSSSSSNEQSLVLSEPDSGRSPELADLRAGPQEGSLMVPASSSQYRLNYHHIFKQKRKLEENWNAGRYRNFQLPHRDHPKDAHTECVYTIQYAGKYLVSGSRDRTLRIWDLDTQRLARKPLHGHMGSVLCLQFDDSEDEDIIISGSSDTHVILWQFSTGQMMRQITNAHRESVLNLRFDKRFLVTCSKDKTIKIWNRQDLKPGDKNYPIKGIKGGGQCPSYIIAFSGIPGTLKFGPSKPEHRMSIEPYTHLMTLDLHGAAVNAIQIYEDQLVSASGDRCLRVWNIHTGECTTKIEAHAKGIACVQYDGKRIVSGSSDNTIRIWDPISHVEVARLEGHSRLVRTIQAAFADVPGGRERLEVEAAEVDRQWRIAQQNGQLTQPSRRGPHPVPGSRKPKDLRGINAKIPPSGGGGRWSHIVSGSYDETVIIWKKTEEDGWVIGHKLRQEEALTAAGPELPSRSEQGQSENLQDQPIVAGPLAPPHNMAAQLIAQAAANARAQQAEAPNAHGIVASGPAALPPLQTPITQNNQAPPPNPHNVTAAHQAHPPALNAQHPFVNGPPHPHPHLPGNRPNLMANAQNGPGGQPNARVFKLQFDARRIICCSQDPKIVGWDFANGDEDIMECSRFFAAPQ